MYHKGNWCTKSYYDTVEEMPKKVKVTFPDDCKDRNGEYEIADVEKLARDEEWYTVQHESNYGICDHWTSWSLMKWLEKRCNKITRYVDKNGNTVGYNYTFPMCVGLTRDAHYWKSEVWNS